MSTLLEQLTPTQLAAVYNHHSDAPVKRFENRVKGARRLAALLARVEVSEADAIAAVIPDAKQAAPLPEAMPVAAAIMAETHAKLASQAAEATFAAQADAIFASVQPRKPRNTAGLSPADALRGFYGLAQVPNQHSARLAAADTEAPSQVRPAVEAQARWLGFSSMQTRNSDHLDIKEISIASLLQAPETAYLAGQADAATKPAKTPRAKPTAAPRASTGTAGTNARALIIAACSRPEGATSAELFETTGWKFASWSHQLKLITAKTGAPHAIRKVDGVTRYFLTGEAG